MYILIIVLILLMIIIWGIADVSQSYASARQAEAAIEAARAAQAASAGNFISILTGFLVVVAILGGVGYILYRLKVKPWLDRKSKKKSGFQGDPMQAMMTMMMMQMVQQQKQLSAPRSRNALPAPVEEEFEEEDALDWLDVVER